MKNLLFLIFFLFITSTLWASSIKFIAMDKYYEKEVHIDSILVYNMNTSEKQSFLSDSIIFETISSIEGIKKINNQQIYPNPVDDILNFNFDDSGNNELIISDIKGKVFFNNNYLNTNSISLNIAGLPRGVYAIRNNSKSLIFVKNTNSNGQEIRLLTKSNFRNSIIKDNELQSQFDYRFTVYSDGFKPYIYYSKPITQDTIVELDMASVKSVFDGKHIRVEFSINCISRQYAGGINDLDYNSKGFQKYTFNYLDTLVYRNGKFEMFSGSYGFDYPFDNHDLSSLKFEIDTAKRTISQFYYLDSYKKKVHYDSNTQDFYSESSSLHFTDTLNYEINEMNQFYIFFKSEQAYVGYEYEHIRVEFNAYEHTDGEELIDFIPDESFIKIEIID